MMDESVKNVTDAFRQSGMWDNTIMIFSTGKKPDTNSLKKKRSVIIFQGLQ